MLCRRFGGRRLQRLDIGRDMEGLDIGELANPVLIEPGEERAYGPVIGHARVVVLDRGGDKIEEPACCAIAGIGDHRGHDKRTVQRRRRDRRRGLDDRRQVDRIHPSGPPRPPRPRAAGIEAPLDTVWVDLADEEGLEISARSALGFGFQGKMCIHPKQIAPVHRVFTPGEAEVAFAERVVAAFVEAEAAGSAAIQLDGKFIDYPILYRAQRVLEKMAAIRTKEAQR
jgi:hypothetical protein